MAWPRKRHRARVHNQVVPDTGPGSTHVKVQQQCAHRLVQYQWPLVHVAPVAGPASEATAKFDFGMQQKANLETHPSHSRRHDATVSFDPNGAGVTAVARADCNATDGVDQLAMMCLMPLPCT